MFVNGQTIQRPDSTTNFVKARCLKEDLATFLQKNTKYPVSALQNNIEGDVILSFVIRKTGKLDSLLVISSPDMVLSQSAFESFNRIDNKWSPTVDNNVPIDKKYLIVFRYRMSMNFKPVDYKRDADDYFKKQKFEKALKNYNKAIEDNQYDYESFVSRAKVKEKLGELEGSKQDYKTSKLLKNEIMTFVDVIAVGYRRLVKTVITTTRIPGVQH
jgi:tetratricopeptide (TPR) repeat protein